MVGNIPNFSDMDVLRCFFRLGRRMGRQELARELQLGEGTIRTILNILKSKKLLESGKKGHRLSAKGNKLMDEISMNTSLPKQINMKKIYPEFKKIVLVLKSHHSWESIYKLRDVAVKNGAEGALILAKERGKIFAPQSDYKMDYSSLEKQFEINNGDVIIISFAGNLREAENGALVIAATIDGTLKKFINQLQN